MITLAKAILVILFILGLVVLVEIVILIVDVFSGGKF